MGKFPIADKALSKMLICKDCSARVSRGSVMCPKCHGKVLRPKRMRKKEGKTSSK